MKGVDLWVFDVQMRQVPYTTNEMFPKDAMKSGCDSWSTQLFSWLSEDFIGPTCTFVIVMICEMFRKPFSYECADVQHFLKCTEEALEPLSSNNSDAVRRLQAYTVWCSDISIAIVWKAQHVKF